MNDLAWSFGPAPRFCGAHLPALATRQGGRCIYCEQEALMPGATTAETRRLGIPPVGAYYRQKLYRHRRATIEHVRRRADGGIDDPANLVMACGFCNSYRDSTEPFAHKTRMMALVRRGVHPCCSSTIPTSGAALRRAVNQALAEEDAMQKEAEAAALGMPPLPPNIEASLQAFSDASFECGAHLLDDDENYESKNAADRAAERALRQAILSAIGGDHHG